MDRLKHQLIAIIALSLGSSIALADTFGIALSGTLFAKDPEHVYGGQVMLVYDPGTLVWRQISLYFDGGYSQFMAPRVNHYRHISIISAAPVVRYHFKPLGSVKPYLDFSVGPSYLNRTRFEYHDLGMHFAFQDRVGMGIVTGKRDQFSIGLSAIHYSNASMSEHNPGITIPFMLNASYNFA